MSTVSSKKPAAAKSKGKPTGKAAPSKAKAPATQTKPPVAPAPVAAVGSAPAVPATQAKPAVVESLSPVVAGRELRKKELFDLVTTRAGMKKKDVKPVVEAMLEVLGEAVAQHRVMHLMPLGKVKIQRAKELEGGRAVILKVRQNNPEPAKPDGDD